MFVNIMYLYTLEKCDAAQIIQLHMFGMQFLIRYCHMIQLQPVHLAQ